MNQLDSPCAIKTKKKLAAALKELMKNSTFDKITVSDITEKCNVHRQTFYYHFQDRYELLDWIFYNEIIEPFTDNVSSENIQEKFFNLFETMSSNKKFYQNALKTNGDDLTRYISKVASDQFTDIFRNLSKESGINASGDDEDVLMAEFFGYGICGVVMNWAIRGMKESPESITRRIEHFFENCKKLKD
ncbi:MAG: dihydroxyacetone kinase transcriptional activator DhaS [Eubacterium sp.]|nr:dihydroxyacetone kinase transcriptional activator DhaS [Eubacterium sp.]